MGRVLVLICVLAVAAAAVLSAGAGVRAAPPPGATAQCRDGTYSYSTHHSGTCSHHGGVAAWLDGSATRSGGTTAVRLGRTVVLGRRTRTRGCRLGVLPDRRCSPGAVYGGLTKAVLCSPSFRTGSIRSVSESTRHAVEVAYGLAPRSYGHTLEIDHIVPLELGGSNVVANLFPERAPGFHAKDRLENRAHALLCSGALGLRATQRAIAADWRRLYERVFGAAAG